MSHAMAFVAVDGKYDEDELEKAVGEQMAPFDENGEWFRDGSRWDWWVIGGRFSGRLATKHDSNLDYARKGDIDLDVLREQFRQEASEAWEKAKEEKDPGARELIYGIEPGETRKHYIESSFKALISANVFLKDLEWHEAGRLGFFGMTINPESGGGEGIAICVSTHKRLRQAKVVTHNMEWEEWSRKYYKMFIEPLPDDTWIVAIDYHV